MTSRDPRIDAYIARQADFARPILEELRRRVAQAVEWIAEGKTRNWKYAGC
ncbi:hypothetical protein [Luteimonas changyuni]|uniref:hypothetical protein n=1 Tax=Luteimonas sp. MJ145 TaxID=3129234 RepID=UPI0031BB4140